MAKCGYDRVFYRVFCATLLSVAVTFMVILTNVFVDIDSLLAGREKANDKPGNPTTTAPTPAPPYREVDNSDILYQQEFRRDNTIDGRADTKDNYEVNQPDENQDLESSDLKPDEDYRTKRSIDVTNIKIRLKNPKIKEFLNNKLSTLLEELDEEQPQNTNELPVTAKTEKQKILDNFKSVENNTGALHKALHKILVQGIVNHADMNEIYPRVQKLFQNYENDKLNDEQRTLDAIRDNKYNKRNPNPNPYFADSSKAFSKAEENFFNELIKCTKLPKEVDSVNPSGNTVRRTVVKKYDPLKAPKVLIKTVIDIKTFNKNDSKIRTNNIKGLIKLIYNGKSIDFSRMEDDDESKPDFKQKTEARRREATTPELELKEDTPQMKTDSITDNENVVDRFLDKALVQYLKKHSNLENKIRKGRPKRSTKPHKHFSSNVKPKLSKKNKEEGELYVEIETHFNSQGIKGEKRKRIVKGIIDKIRKALNVNVTSLRKGIQKNKNADLLRIRKRFQNPIKVAAENLLLNKILLPVNSIIIRKSDPISNSVTLSEPMSKVYEKNTGDIWQKPYGGPNFLSNLKSINSGEMGLVNLEYDGVLKDNGIPQRLQQPLNTENVDDLTDSNYYNLGDLKFYIKEIEGTGFSIGFNQYVGDAPDPEAIKPFTGLQQLINVYKEDGDEKNETSSVSKPSFAEEHEVSKRDTHKVGKLATIFNQLPLSDYNANEYKVIFDKNYLPYDSYSEIFEDGNKKVTFSIEKEDKKQRDQSEQRDAFKDLVFNIHDHNTHPVSLRVGDTYHVGNAPFYVDENLFSKALKPSEIFGIANLLDRKKRSVKIKQYMNVDSKFHKNRLINTKRKTKRILKNSNKRIKRQVDKIRIVATDVIPHLSGHSNENYYVVSDENMFADRATIREVELSDQDQPEQEENGEFLITPHIRKHLSPYNFFGSKSRQNSLTSKYPHLFLEEITRSKEDDPLFYSKLIDRMSDLEKNIEVTPSPYAVVTPYMALRDSPYQLETNYNAEQSPNYKLTVKIVPKVLNDTETGFKSIRTSINKTINRNGILFLSQVNVSELSKFENVNNPNDHNPIKENQIILQENHEHNISKHQNISNLNSFLNADPKLHLDSGTFPLVKHIKEQQETMKNLLKEHKQRIDEQLNKLKEEKQHIDSMIIHDLTATATSQPEPKKIETFDVLLPLNPPQMLHLNKEEAGQMISNALMKLHNTPQLNDLNDIFVKNPPISTTSPPISATQTPASAIATTSTTIKNPNIKRTIDLEKIKLLRQIQRSENMTSAILYKLDRNTNLLQHFLQKLTETIAIANPRKQESENKPNKYDWQMHGPFFADSKNVSHVSIPFMYAYQQPYPSNGPISPLANVLYQGHIHTNAFNNDFKQIPQNRENLPDKLNRTRFFLDNLETGFKHGPIAIPVAYRNATYSIPRVKNNITMEYI